MSTQHELGTRLDESFGDGPPLRPVSDHLAAGRKAVRRRRAAVAVGGVAAAAVVGGSAWIGTGGGDPDPRVVEPAASPSGATSSPSPTESSPTESPTESTPSPVRTPPAGIDFLEPAQYDKAGTLWIKKGWRELERVPNPMGYHTPGMRSVGLELARGEQRRYVLVTDQGDGSMSSWGDPATGDLAGWLESKVALQHGLDIENGVVPPDGSGVPVRMTAGGLVATGGAEILAQDREPDLGERFAPPGAPTAAARVRLADGSIVHVVGRMHGGPVAITDYGDFDTLDEFLAYAAEKYAAGEGLR